MPVNFVSSRDYAHDLGRAKRLTADRPVFITDRAPAFALLDIEAYHQLTRAQPCGLVEALDAIDERASEFEPLQIDGDHKLLNLD